MREGHVSDKWVRVASLAEIPGEGLGHAVKAEGLDIALFRWNDRIYAIEDLCPHLGFPMSEGIMQLGDVEVLRTEPRALVGDRRGFAHDACVGALAITMTTRAQS